MNTTKLISSSLSIAALAVMGMGVAQANINPAAPNTPLSIVPAGGGLSTFTYNIIVDAQQTVNTGDFFTFYDIQGYADNSMSTNAGFTATASLLGPPAVGATGSAAPNDDPNLTNLTFTYNGTAPITGQQSLGLFSFRSSFGTASAPEAFVGRATVTASSLKNANLTSYFGPGGSPTAVPEPATVIPFALGGLGLLGLIARKTRRTSGTAA